MSSRIDTEHSRFNAAYEAISQGAEAFVKGLGVANLVVKSKPLRIQNDPKGNTASFTLQVRSEGTSKHFEVSMQSTMVRVKDLDSTPHIATARNSASGYVFSTPIQALGYITEAIETKFCLPQ
jgi:hypothetical protein